MNDSPMAILARYPSIFRPIGKLEPLGNSGGYSGARLWRLESARGRHVLRRWPIDGLNLREIERVHGWLVEASDLGFLPVPVKSIDGRTVIDDGSQRWELAPWLEGTPDLARPPSSTHLRGMFASLASFHARLAKHATTGQSPGLMARARELERLIAGEFDQLRTVIDAQRVEPAARLARIWLDRVSRVAPRILDETRLALVRTLPLQPCLRDARPDHFLFESGQLTGVVDFGAMGVDTVAGDLARLMAEAIGLDRPAMAEAYRTYDSIRPLSDAESRLIAVFERANAVLGPARWVRWKFVEAREFDEPDAVVRGLRRGLERLDESGL